MAYLIFDGVDGAGKTTLARAVKTALEARGDRVFAQAFPSHEGAIGKLIRATFGAEVAVPRIREQAMLFLFLADGVDQEPLLRAALARGEHVILDRHPQYTVQAYQTTARNGEPPHDHQNVDQWTPHCLFRVPDAVFVVDVPPAVALARRQAREAAGAVRNARYESDDLAYLEEQRDIYVNLVAPEEEIVRVLDGEEPTDVLVGRVLKHLDHLALDRAERT